MKKKLSFRDKLRTCIHIFKNHIYACCIIEVCPFCHSIAMDKISERCQTGKRIHYRVKFRCRNCGASARVKEIWKR